MEWWLLTFFLGAILSLFLPIVPEFYLLILILVLALLLLRIRKYQYLALLMLGACWLLIFASITINKLSNNGIELATLHKQNILVRGTIATIVKQQNKAFRYNFMVSHWQNEALSKPFYIRLNWQKPSTTLLQGQKWQFLVRLKPAHGLANSGSFNYKTWLLHNEIVATGYVKHDAAQVTKKGIQLNNLLLSNSTTWRQKMYLKIKASLADKPLAGLLLALGFGERGELTKQQWHVLLSTATIHLIAISGLHIGIVAFFSLKLFRIFFDILPLHEIFTGKQTSKLMQLNIYYLPVFLSCILAWYYAYLAGYSIPTLRALVMLFLYWLLRRSASQVSLIRWFFLTILVILLLWPLSLLSASFWLSVSALTIIFLTSSYLLNTVENNNAQAIYQRELAANNSKVKFSVLAVLLKIKSRVLQWGKTLLIIQLSLTVCMLPIAALLNYQLPLVAFFANVFAVPMMSISTIPLTLFSVIALPINDTLSLFFLHLANTSMELVWQWLSYLSEIEWAQIMISQAQLLFIFLLIIVSIFMAYCRFNNTISLTLTGFLVILYLLNQVKDDETKWQLSALDVGHGLAVIIEKNKRVFLYDTGANYPSGFNMAEAAIVPYLKSRGVNAIDGIIASHNDNDHVGGLSVLREHFPIKRVIANDFNLMPNSFCLPGSSFTWQGLSFDMLSPQGLVGDKNDDSCVVLLSDGVHRVLLPGDISTKAERRLISRVDTKSRLNSDVLIAPHHGSKSSSSGRFLDAVSPRYAIFSAGYLNQWNMPSEQILQRYQLQDIITFNTAELGMVTFEFSALAIEPVTFKEDIEPYWFVN